MSSPSHKRLFSETSNHHQLESNSNAKLLSGAIIDSLLRERSTSSVASTQLNNVYATAKGNLSNQSSQSSIVISAIEAAILKSTVPIDINETEEITVNGEKGIWANKFESMNWKGAVPLSQYPINEDAEPEIVTKRTQQQVVYQQEVAIRYLRPPTPPAPGEILIQQETNSLVAPAPPLVIRQQPPRPVTPQPLVIREAPPTPPPAIGKKIITISGKRIPPPPRKVVIERLAPLPSKPQSVIIERWLPYAQVKRKVIFQKAKDADQVSLKPKNVIIQWEPPQVMVKKEFKDLGVIRANPTEYVARYGSSLKKSDELPSFVLEIRPPTGMMLAADYGPSGGVYELEGDIEALRYVDLDKEGLAQYRNMIETYQAQPPQLQQQQQPPQLQQLQQQARQSTAHLFVESSNRSTSTSPTLVAGSRTPPPPAANHLPIKSMPGGKSPVSQELYSSFDRDLEDRVSIDEAQKLLIRLNSRLGRRTGEDDVKKFIGLLGRTIDGYIDLNEFKRLFESFVF